MDGRLDRLISAVSPFAWTGILSGISEIDGFKGWWAGRFPQVPAAFAKLARKTAARSANASTRIGWSGVPRHPAGPARAPQQEPPGGTRSSGSAYERLLKEVFDRNAELPVSADLVLRLHEDLLGGSQRGPSGVGWRAAPDRSLLLPRRTAESITLRPSAPENIPSEMEGLIRWVNSRLASREFHPLVVIAVFLLEFHAIRPFTDGNGRVSRLLTNLLLLRGGYGYVPYASLESAIEERKTEYYLALRKSQSSRSLPHPDMTSWLTAFLDTLRAQVRELRGSLEGKPPENRLSANQAAVLALSERHGEVTNRLVARTLSLPRETSKQVLNRLLALGFLERIGSGRATRYRRTPAGYQG